MSGGRWRAEPRRAECRITQTPPRASWRQISMNGSLERAHRPQHVWSKVCMEGSEACADDSLSRAPAPLAAFSRALREPRCGVHPETSGTADSIALRIRPTDSEGPSQRSAAALDASNDIEQTARARSPRAGRNDKAHLRADPRMHVGHRRE